MRIALVVTPLALPDMRPAPGSLDGDLIRSRLPLDDAGFRVIDLDPAVDLAEQIDTLFEKGDAPRDAAVLFYASCSVMLSAEGELFLALDPSSPETGDSVRELALVLRERVRTPAAFVIECRHAPDPEDPFISATIVAAAKEAVAVAHPGIELLVAAQPLAAGDTEDRAAPLTRALIEAIDEQDASAGLTIAQFFESARESPRIVGAVPCFAHAKGASSFELLPLSAEARAALAAPPAAGAAGDEPDVVASEPQLAAEDEAVTAEMAPLDEAEMAEVLAAAEASEEDAPYGEEPARVPVEVDGPPPPALVDPLPRVVISTPPPKAASVAPPPAPSSPPKAASVAPPATPPPPKVPTTAGEHMATGDALRVAGDHEGALSAYKRALALLSPGAGAERADVYVRQGQVKQAQDKRREAIAAYEKAISLSPLEGAGVVPAAHAAALEALVELNVAEGDWKAVAAAEERVLATVRDPDDRFEHLMTFGARWQELAADPARARSAFERARDIVPDHLGVLSKLRVLYEQASAVPEALAVRRRIAELTREPRARAEQYFELGKECLSDLRREELGLELLDKALESDPTMLEPLAVIARVLADKQEWSELEQAYRRMLGRVEHMPEGPIRTEVTWELCRRLGNTFRDHLDDPALALDAFEDAVHEKPGDLATRLTAAEIARSLGKNDRAAAHLEAAAALDPARIATFHDLFECFQKLRRPDQAYQAACVTMFLQQADARERFVFEEHKPHGVPAPTYALRAEAWEWLRPHDRDVYGEAVLAAVTPAAIAARLSQLGAEGRLPALDPAGRQDPEKTTVSIVRSFAWASHFLSVPAPAVYLSDDPDLALASVIAEEPTVFAGNKVLRGRSLPELAFLVGRHLAYHVGGHRLLLYYPSIEELTAVFLAAVRIVLPEVPAPASLRTTVLDLERAIALRLGEAPRVDLAAAVAAFERNGSRAHLAEWVASVERCATRAGYLLAGDLDVASRMLAGESHGVLGADAKMADLIGFAVSDEHRALREALGVAILP